MSAQYFRWLSQRATPWRRAATIFVALALLSCSSSTNKDVAWVTKLMPAAKGVALDPPAPSSVLWVRPTAAVIPTRTAGGKLWDDVGGWPDAFAVFTVNGREVMRTEVVTDSLKPKWVYEGGNFEISAGAELRIDLFDADALKDIPIGSARFSAPTREELASGELELDIGRRGLVRLAIAEAQALLGLGFDYMFVRGDCVARQVLKHSPAGRAGMRVGDQIVNIAGRKVKAMGPKDVMSAFNAVPAKGILVVVLHEGGTTQSMTLLEGPVYPLHGELPPAD